MQQRRIVGKRIVKSFWNCPYCNRTHIDGLVDYCPGCGRHKLDTTKYDLDRNNIVEVSEKELKKAGIIHSENGEKRPDWKCAYCNSLNNWADEFCSSCASPKSEATEDYFGEIHENTSSRTENVSSDTKDTEKYEDSYTNKENNLVYCNYKSTASTYKETSNYKRNRSYKNYISKDTSLIGSLLFPILSGIGIIGLILFLFLPFKVSTEVSGFEWNRSIAVEEERTVRESDWDVPVGARVYAQKEELYDTDRVIDYYEKVERTETKREIVDYDISYETEYEDNGDGTQTEYTVEIKTPIYDDVEYTVEEEVPVYKDVEIFKTKYYYELDKWFIVDTYTSYGTDKNPYWNENYTLGNKQRDTYRSEVYTIKYSNGDIKNSSYDEWMQTELGDSVTITKCRLGIVYNQTEE